MQKAISNILSNFKSIPRQKRKKTFMEIAGFPHYENVCSNILAFYLNPANEHELKDLVLNSLMYIVETDFSYDIDFEKMEVIREYQTSKNNRIDILIQSKNYVVVIENKIYHGLHNDLADYYQTVNTLCKNERKAICILLTLNKLPIDDYTKHHFVNITYEQLFQNITQNIGSYLNNTNIGYINHLTDFIKSVKYLISNTMEDKALWEFFKNNYEDIDKLTESFNEFKTSISKNVYSLKEAVPQNKFAASADKQWIYDNRCLVHDFTINSIYKVSVDTYISFKEGWEIQLFGRNKPSTEFIFNIMCKDSDFLPKPFESYEHGKRLVFHRFNHDEDINVVAEVLIDLLLRIEKYKQKTE